MLCKPESQHLGLLFRVHQFTTLSLLFVCIYMKKAHYHVPQQTGHKPLGIGDASEPSQDYEHGNVFFAGLHCLHTSHTHSGLNSRPGCAPNSQETRQRPSPKDKRAKWAGNPKNRIGIDGIE